MKKTILFAFLGVFVSCSSAPLSTNNRAPSSESVFERVPVPTKRPSLSSESVLGGVIVPTKRPFRTIEEIIEADKAAIIAENKALNRIKKAFEAREAKKPQKPKKLEALPEWKVPIPTPRPEFKLPSGKSYENPPGLTDIYVLFSPKCKNFIKDDGSIGPWGQEWLKAMEDVDQKKGRSCFSDEIDFGQRCKGFQAFTEEQKQHVWVWLWASIAQAESSCKPDAQTQGIWNERYNRYNIADGLVQLEHWTETRNGNGRDKGFCPDNWNSQEVSFQANCSSSIMADTQCGGYLKDENSYWQKIRLDGGEIWNLLKKHPLCKE